jgi:hypothetical protein
LHQAIWDFAAYGHDHGAGEDEEKLVANLSLHNDGLSTAVAAKLHGLFTPMHSSQSSFCLSRYTMHSSGDVDKMGNGLEVSKVGEQGQ